MARSMGIVCYVLAGLLLVAALIVPVIGVILIMILSALSGAASSTMTIGSGHHGGPEGLILELAVYGILWLLDILGPIPAILAALLTIVVEIGLIVGAGLLFLLGGILRRRRKPRASVGPALTPLPPGPQQARLPR